MRRMTIIKCAECGKEYERKISAANEAIRNGWKQYCSTECKSKGKSKGTITQCANCGKSLTVIPSELAKSKTGKIFCGHSCSAQFSNAHRIHSKETKEKMRNSAVEWCKNNGHNIFPKIEKICPVCGKRFITKYDNTCSLKCGQIRQFGYLPYTKEETLKNIKELSLRLGRTPGNREVKNGLVNAATRFFGSWNKAVQELGLKPNQEGMYGKTRVICKDGHRAESISEMIVDDWLFERGIEHKRNIRYPESRMICDFYLPKKDIWVEYLGLCGKHEYDDRTKRKKQLVKEQNLKTIWLLPKHLYPERKLDEIFKQFGM